MITPREHRVSIFDMNGVKVGVESAGDPGSNMESTMESFVESGCAVIVTACRTRGNTFDKVKDYLGRDNGYSILWLTHYIIWWRECRRSPGKVQ